MSALNRVGVVALAALGMALGAGGVAAASTSSGFGLHAGDLVLSSTAGVYTGDMAVTVRNTSPNPVSDAVLDCTYRPGCVSPASPAAGAARHVFDVTCGLDAFAAGERRTVTSSFGSYAGPANSPASRRGGP